jgi:hypothetical protein
VSSHRDTAVAIAIRRELSMIRMVASYFAKDGGGTDIFHPIDLFGNLRFSKFGRFCRNINFLSTPLFTYHQRRIYILVYYEI